jgi:hypothetical protein
MLYTEFRQKVMVYILDLIQLRNCSRFQILGYKYLDIKLILYYDDCNEVFVYKLRGDDNDEIQRTAYFTANFKGDDLLEQSKQFKHNWDKDQIEEGRIANVISLQ